MINKSGSITAVGLGPGDAELITIKGYKALKNADIIFYPASSVKDKTIHSFSGRILDQLELNVPAKPLYIPMKSKQREKYYQEAYNQINKEYKNGLDVVIVSEGDILFYSTFGYLWKFIQNEGLECSLIPGIPAFIAAGGLGPVPLAEGNNGLQVISCPVGPAGIKNEIKKQRTLVIMKLSKFDNWDSFFKELEHPFLYAEKVGTPNQFITNDPNDLTGREIPYFSLLIIYN